MGLFGGKQFFCSQYGDSLPGNEVAFKGLMTMDIRLISVLE